MEKREARTISFRHDGHAYTYMCEIDCTTKNVKYYGDFLVDGERKDVRAFKSLGAKL